ncbi:MAG: hypothetical protein NC388_05805 [Clostridium sp.]|nr:hypothetical protein [Clostridium sp.]
MHFFKKSAGTPQPAQTPQTAPPPDTSPTSAATELSPEEQARRWFQQRFGTTMPDEVVTLFRSVARAEAQRNRAAGERCSKQELTQIREARRLCETKLENTEQSLERLRHQQEWFTTFITLTHKLDTEKATLYELNKRFAAVTGQARELDRYEAFESVQGIFQRIRVWEELIRRNKTAQTEAAIRARQLKEHTRQAEESYNKAAGLFAEAEDRLSRTYDTLAEGHHINGAMSVLQTDLKRAESQAARLQQTLFALDKERLELTNENERLHTENDRQKQELQNLSAHRMMLDHNETVQCKLDILLEAHRQCIQLQHNLESNRKRQNEQNELLNRLFLQHQELDQQIHSLQSELQVHRRSNHGLDNYSLQERAMKLKDRRQRLQSASLLWKRISAGYEGINEKEQAIIRLQLHTEHQATIILQLERETTVLRQQCEELKYAYTLSKSQNVIQLRGDLREGQHCTVCGATHHPFHSDTMLEQSKLISEIKTDFELTADELKKKEQLLLQLKLEQASETSKLTEERIQLEEMKQRHKANVQEWEPYQAVDRSFADCSSSTNMEARKLMLQQLIEKTGVDAEEAQKELDSFNFHQNRINQINERIAQCELDKGNIVVRLNEVNTACQVLAHNVENLQKYNSDANRRYSQLYEELDRMVSLPGWQKEWLAGAENIKMRIQQMTERWIQLNNSIKENGAVIKQKKDMIGNLDLRIKNLRGLLDNINEAKTATEELIKDKQNTYRKLLGEKDVKKYSTELKHAMDERRTEERLKREELQQAKAKYLQAEGELTALEDDSRRLEEMTAAEREKLDLWMRRYNANHPPVQLIELERVFASEHDWNQIRETVRGLSREMALAQARVDSIRAELTAHQADGMRPAENEEDTREAMKNRQLQLEQKRREILSQIAAYDVRLAAHERSLEQINVCSEEIQDLTSPPV